MSSAIQFGKRLKRWIKWIFWDSFHFSFPIWLFLIPYVLPSLWVNDYFKYMGLFLRIAGFVLILYGIDQKLKRFTGGGISGIFKKWWNNRPRSRSLVVKLDSGSYVMDTSEVNTHYKQNFENWSTEKQLEYLFKTIEKLEQQLGSQRKEFDRELKLMDSKIKNIESKTSRNVMEVSKEVELSATGNVKIEFSGAIAVIIGVIFGSVPNWLIMLF